MANFVTTKGDEIQSFVGNSGLSQKKQQFLCCNYSEEKKKKEDKIGGFVALISEK